jgi:hypothetical protein
MAQGRSFRPNQTAYHLSKRAVAVTSDWPTGARRNDMHPQEIMKPDLLSEIVLMTFGTLILSSLVWFAMAAFARP